MAPQMRVAGTAILASCSAGWRRRARCRLSLSVLSLQADMTGVMIGVNPHKGSNKSQLSDFTGGRVNGNGAGSIRHQMGLRAFLTNRRYLILLAGTAGTWFPLDYAYYGNTISTPQILSLISPHASTVTKIALQLAIFVVAALPGYLLAIAYLDRIGHRRLQLVGFAVMALCFAVIALVPGMTTSRSCWSTG